MFEFRYISNCAQCRPRLIMTYRDPLSSWVFLGRLSRAFPNSIPLIVPHIYHDQLHLVDNNTQTVWSLSSLTNSDTTRLSLQNSSNTKSFYFPPGCFPQRFSWLLPFQDQARNPAPQSQGSAGCAGLGETFGFFLGRGPGIFVFPANQKALTLGVIFHHGDGSHMDKGYLRGSFTTHAMDLEIKNWQLFWCENQGIPMTFSYHQSWRAWRFILRTAATSRGRWIYSIDFHLFCLNRL